MIKVETIENSYMTCQSCNSKEELLKVLIGFTERQTTSIRLCKKCRDELVREIKK